MDVWTQVLTMLEPIMRQFDMKLQSDSFNKWQLIYSDDIVACGSMEPHQVFETVVALIQRRLEGNAANMASCRDLAKRIIELSSVTDVQSTL